MIWDGDEGDEGEDGDDMVMGCYADMGDDLSRITWKASRVSL